MTYVRIFEYVAAASTVETFVRVYGSDGDWARLFAQSDGFRGTELLRSTVDPLRFVTIDRFVDAAAWERFREQHATAYEALGTRYGDLSVSQGEVCAAVTL